LAIKHLLKEIRPVALSLIEGIQLRDEHLVSAIGNSYGDIYEQHLDLAKNSRMNHTKQGDAIPDGFEEYIMPIVRAKL
jgi:hypothetical protein